MLRIGSVLVSLAGFGTHHAFAQDLIVTGPPAQTVAGAFTGWFVAGPGAVVNTNGPVTINNTAAFGNAIHVVNGGIVNILNPSTITTNGENSASVIVEQPGSTATLLDTRITQTGPGGTSGITVHDGATITMIGGSITNTSPEILAPAIAMGGGQAVLTNVTVTSVGDSIIALGAAPEINPNGVPSIVSLTGSTLTPASGIALITQQAADITVRADASQITGAMLTDPTSTSTVNLANGTAWQMTGSSNLTNLTNSASTINFTPPVADPTQLASYKTLTVTNYAGANGTIGLNTFLGTDSSPSDRVVIDGGTATGTTFLNIANTVGTGALTTGSGILVVDAINGATTDDAFRLAGPVIAGPFEYMLFKGDGNPEAWYLRSTIPGVPDPCPLPPAVGPTPGQPAIPEPELPPGEAPNYRQEVSLYAALPNLGLLYGRKLLDTLHQRVGEETGADRDPAMGPHGAWGRVIGQRGSRDGGCPVLVGPTFDYGFAALQAGFDALRVEHRDGSRDRAGVYAALGDAHSDVTHAGALSNVFAGRDAFSAYSVGAYWTHYGTWGWYLDGVLQGTRYDVEAQSTRIPALETNGWGYAASLEAGIPYRGLFAGLAFLGGMTVEPQAQFVYQAIDLAEASDGAARVRFDNVDSLAGRLGVRFATNWAMPGPFGLGPAPATVWFRPSYWHEFSDDAGTLISSEFGFLPFPSNIAEDWVELNAGLTLQVGRGTALYASGSYDTATDGNGDAWDGRIGLKVTW